MKREHWKRRRSLGHAGYFPVWLKGPFIIYQEPDGTWTVEELRGDVDEALADPFCSQAVSYGHATLAEAKASV